MSVGAASASRISVIMPVFNGERFLPLSLSPLIAMVKRAEILEVIVVDDGSYDRSATIAAQSGATVVHTGGRKGAAAARNTGVTHANGDILWFVDADVVVHEDAARIVKANCCDGDMTAIFGSYDDCPLERNFLSQYKNLVHHYYHQRASGRVSTFWAGCGAVYKNAFLSVGGFDSETYRLPGIEDIELGYRLGAAGYRIRLVPELQGQHMKVWHFANLLQTDIFQRAIPWSRLILRGTAITKDLNIGVSERWRAALAGSIAVGLLAAVVQTVPWWLPLALLLVALLVNWRLFRFLRHRNGYLFALGGIFFHQIYYIYSLAAFAWAWIETVVVRRHMIQQVP
jgi:glycosyltransferase involved in cell wall biosynthesis